jgi:acetylornithine deacetylase/succinyl-diaminopimelate desuccinylase-like protein
MNASTNNSHTRVWGALVLVAAVGMASPALAAGAGGAPAGDGEGAFRELYKELVETNTTLSAGSCTAAAEKMAVRLRRAGMPSGSMQVLAPPEHPQSGSLVASYPGRNAKLQPILLLAHIDVVEARREDWERDPFTLVEEGGFFYARGASDDKAMAAIFTDLLVRWSERGHQPQRGVTLALTCGEETPAHFNGVSWLLQTRPELLRAEFVVNEGASGLLDADGKHLSLEVQAGEKVYQDFKLEVMHQGGHSSRPTRENPIVRMAAAVTRIGAHRFPVALNDATRGYFLAQADMAKPEVAADMRAIVANPNDDAAAQRLWTANPGWNGMLRTTCVPTQFAGGHANNALPQRAAVNVNCRILPGVPPEQLRDELARVVADDSIKVELAGDRGLTAPVPPLTAAIMDPIREIAGRMWPNARVVPTMATGATDGRFLNAAGIPTYGVSGVFIDAAGSGAHGLNERIRVRSLLDARHFLQELVASYTRH